MKDLLVNFPQMNHCSKMSHLKRISLCLAFLTSLLAFSESRAQGKGDLTIACDTRCRILVDSNLWYEGVVGHQSVPGLVAGTHCVVVVFPSGRISQFTVKIESGKTTVVEAKEPDANSPATAGGLEDVVFWRVQAHARPIVVELDRIEWPDYFDNRYGPGGEVEVDLLDHKGGLLRSCLVYQRYGGIDMAGSSFVTSKSRPFECPVGLFKLAVRLSARQYTMFREREKWSFDDKKIILVEAHPGSKYKIWVRWYAKTKEKAGEYTIELVEIPNYFPCPDYEEKAKDDAGKAK